MAKKLKWQFGEAEELLENEVNAIVGEFTVEQLLALLPAEMQYDETQNAHLQIRKLGNIVWQVSYVIYKDPYRRDFEKVCISYVTEPSLKLALFEMYEEIKKEGF